MTHSSGFTGTWYGVSATLSLSYLLLFQKVVVEFNLINLDWSIYALSIHLGRESALLMSNKCKPEEREKLMGIIEIDIFLISPKAAEPFARDVSHMLSERGHLDLLIQHMVIK